MSDSASRQERYQSLSFTTSDMDRLANKAANGQLPLPDGMRARDLVDPGVAQIIQGLHPKDRGQVLPYSIEIRDWSGKSRVFETSELDANNKPIWQAGAGTPGFNPNF